MSDKIAEILLVEDDLDDALLTQEAFSACGGRVRIQALQDGEQAMAYLRRQGKFSDARRPDLVLLDLSMPRKDGREVLAEIKGDPGLRSIPVIVLTSSKSERDIREAYERHANCYIAKPTGLRELQDAVRLIQDFWTSLVQLPPKVI